MKLDLANMIQILIIISFILCFVSYTTHFYRNRVSSIRNEVYKEIFVPITQYLRALCIRDYVAFEKYGVWRYSGRF